MKVLKWVVKRFFPKKLLKGFKDLRLNVKGHKNERLFKGQNVICPCCGKTFSRFMDYIDDHPRFKDTCKNTQCPYCFSAPRHRIVCSYLENNIDNVFGKRDNTIIVFGAEYSIRKWFHRNGFRYVTSDLFDRTADIMCDIQNTPFPNETWDLIVCNHVLEHVPDYKKSLKELQRILKKDGLLELTVPTDRNFETVFENPSIVSKEERTKIFGQYDHVRIFGNDFENILVELGFSVEVVDGNNLPDNIVGVIGPANYDDNRVYLCRKNVTKTDQ
jgi:predicted SAM-dependent methyltransferase